MNHESNKWIRFFSIYHNIMFFSSCLCARLIGCCLLGFKLIFHYCIQQLVKNFISSRCIGSDFFLYVSQLIGFFVLFICLADWILLQWQWFAYLLLLDRWVRHTSFHQRRRSGDSKRVRSDWESSAAAPILGKHKQNCPSHNKSSLHTLIW